MNDKNTSTPLETDWDRLDKMTDEEIDYSDIPPLDDKFFAKAKVYVPPSKRENFVQVDEGVLAWFKAQGEEYQTMINEILKKYIEKQGAQLPKLAEEPVKYHVEKKLDE
ncbi:MAG TPA: BrnA antitoxin family protein [Anaerolineales bacterium]|nr:BrnA antitoxin family protein [Anaerolineales bacterium]